MAKFTLTELTELLRDCAGVDESVDMDSDILDITFKELGYDSLALFNTVNRIERDHGIQLTDDLASDAGTPRSMIMAVNQCLTQPA